MLTVRYTADASDVSMIQPTCTSTDSSEEPDSLPPLKLRFTVFIDGTGNNMFNTQTRLTEDRAPDDSYRNEYTNIAKLANYINTVNSTNDYHVAVYVEGMGTEHGSDDDINGMGFGTGSRGVIERVTTCNGMITNEVARLGRHSNRTISELKIEAFGFSRGAAAARHFIHRVSNAAYGQLSLVDMIDWRRFTIAPESVVIPFVGLYDCVASFRILGLLGPLGSIENDTAELNLNCFENTQKVVHIVAADEFRLNFPVTNIRSAGRRKGKTIYVPGVHSDVGGGYNNISEGHMHENNLPILQLHFAIADGFDVIRPIQRRYAQEVDRLVSLGWYTRDEFLIRPEYDPSHPNSILSFSPLRVNRSGIRNTYTRVTLKLMAHEATNAGLSFLPTLASENPLTGILADAYSYINSNQSRSAADWNTDTNPMMLTLRHEYFHFSSHYIPTHGLGTDWALYPMNSQFHSDQYGYEDSDRNVIAGVRVRKILRG